MIVMSVAALARVIPYTFASFGIVELVMVVMFRVFGEGFLGGTTVAMLCALLLNSMTFVLFLMAVWAEPVPEHSRNVARVLRSIRGARPEATP